MSSARASTSGRRASTRWALARDACAIVLTGIVLGVAFNALERSSRPRRGLAWVPAVQRLDDVGSVIQSREAPEARKPPEFPQVDQQASRQSLPVAASATFVRPHTVVASAATPAPAATPTVLPPERSKPDAPEDLAPTPPGAHGVRTTVPAIPDLGRPLRVDLPLVSELVAAGAALVVDARDREEFVDGHIPGAVSIPYDQAMADPARIEALDAGGRPIIVYCSGGTCESSRYLADLMVREFHKQRVLVYEGGFPEWAAAGRPVTKGTE